MLKLMECEKNDLRALAAELFEHNFKQAITCRIDKDGYPRYQVRRWEEEHLEDMEEMGVELFCGATRVVISSCDDDWVLKFDIQHPDHTCSYNEREAENFKKACEAGLDEYFAAMYYIGEVCGVKVYAQEKVNMDEDKVSDEWTNYLVSCGDYDECETDEEKYEAASYDTYNMDQDERVYAMLGSGCESDKVICFLDDNSINDLHAANWGYRNGNLEPVMVDYAGF